MHRDVQISEPGSTFGASLTTAAMCITKVNAVSINSPAMMTRTRRLRIISDGHRKCGMTA